MKNDNDNNNTNNKNDEIDYDRLMANNRRLTTRRNTIPLEFEDPEDFTVGEQQSEMFPVHVDECRRTKETEDSWVTMVSTQLPKEARNMLAGGLAGMLAKTFVAPVDRIKILYQVSSAQFQLRDVPNVVRNIIIEEGPMALWKGNLATMLRVFPYAGIQFMVFDYLKQWMLQEQHQELQTQSRNHDRKYGLSPIESLFSGMIAGTVSVICTYPLDLTRTQLAVLSRKTNHQGFVSVLTENYTHRGLPGLFRGMTPTLIGILPYSGIAYALNEQGKREIQFLTGREVTTVERMQCGAFAGLVAQTLTYPIELIRRRMQTIGLVGTHNDTALGSIANGQQASKQWAQKMKPPSLTSAVQDVHQEQGIRGFFKGVSMNWVKGPLAFSVSFTAFDSIQKLLETPEEREQRARFYNGRSRE